MLEIYIKYDNCVKFSFIKLNFMLGAYKSINHSYKILLIIFSILN